MRAGIRNRLFQEATHSAIKKLDSARVHICPPQPTTPPYPLIRSLHLKKVRAMYRVPSDLEECRRSEAWTACQGAVSLMAAARRHVEPANTSVILTVLAPPSFDGVGCVLAALERLPRARHA